MSWLITPFGRVGGRLPFIPLSYTIIQTDGSYKNKPTRTGPKAKVAAIICHPKVTSTSTSTSTNFLKAVTASSSTEAEWISIVMGLQFALDQNHEKIAIENDCLSVVEAILNPRYKPTHEYARHYREQINILARATDWTGARWIPRELNRADELFR